MYVVLHMQQCSTKRVPDHTPVLKELRTPPPVFVVVVEGAGIALSAQSRGALTGVRFVVR